MDVVLRKAGDKFRDYYIQQCMPKKVARRKDSDEENEEVEDIMAWGKKKENYYKDSQNQYSSLEEEEQEARKIYEHQLEQLQDPQIYEIPQAESEEDVSQEEDGTSEKGLSHAYLTKEIKSMVKLGLKISEQSDSKARSLLETYIQSYLMALIALRELKIPYIEYHPIVNKALQLKEDIGKLKHLLESSTVHDGEQYEDEEEEQIEEQEQDEEEDEEQQQEELLEDEDEFQNDIKIKEGLKIYEQTKAKQEQAKKIKKGLKKVQREGKKKPAFAEVKGNEGRLANEKILKNKGLIKKRKKMDRNSRVKLRRKFDKASSKRRAYGHFIRENPGREYEGERNIKYGRIASVKLK